MVVPSDGVPGPSRRLIVLGASNVTRGLAVVGGTAAEVWGQPLDLMGAIGHGRSFGLTSSVLGRTLPSIRASELWDEWRAREPLPTAAVITDIGNDILYGASPSQISQWVGECARRLRDRCDRVVITGLPLENLARLGPLRFVLLRSILFPQSRLTQRTAVERAAELDGLVRELARELGLEQSFPDPNWYGFDPIHIRRRHWPVAWLSLLGPLTDRTVDTGTIERPADRRWKLRSVRPQRQQWFGLEQRRLQPAWTGPDGSRLSLY